jgi:hypothetical protein
MHLLGDYGVHKGVCSFNLADSIKESNRNIFAEPAKEEKQSKRQVMHLQGFAPVKLDGFRSTQGLAQAKA